MATEAARLLARIGADVSELQKGMNDAGRIIDRGGKDLQKPAAKAGQAIGASMAQSMSMALSGGIGGISRMLMGLVPGAAILGGVAILGKEVMELANLGAQAERTRSSFERLFRLDAEVMLGPLRAASRGAISDTDLLATATKANMLGVATGVDEMTKLMEVARVRGQLLGLSTTQAFGDIVTGIGRASPLILDNLGIVTGGAKLYDDWAESIGKTAEQLTEAEKKQALLNKVLTDSAPLLAAQEGQAEDAATGMERLAAARKDLTDVFATGVALSAAAGGGVASGAGALEGLAEWISKGNAASTVVYQFADRLRELRKEGKLTWFEVAQLSLYSNHLANSVTFGSMTLARQTVEMSKLERQAGLANSALADFTYQEMLASEQAAGLSPLIDAVADSMAGLANVQRYVGYQPWMEEFASEQQAGMWAGGPEVVRGPVASKDVEAMLAARDTAGKLQRDYGAVAGSAKKAASGVSDLTRALDSMRSMVEQAFQPTTVTGRDWLETQMGVYQDKPDEYLRRLRSAATDAGSLWKEMLGGRTGAEAELYVAQQEEAWQTGQWEQMGPEFDPAQARESIINAAIQQVQAERARQAMITDIMRDPRLVGMGLSATEAAKVTGAPMAAAGVEQAQMLVTGAREVDVGAQLTKTIEEQFQATSDTWVLMGELSLQWFFQGQEAASPTIATNLAKLLFPYLHEQLTQVGFRP